MPFKDSLDIANRACFHCGVDKIDDVNEDSQRNRITFVSCTTSPIR
jgi:hypothetical protein